MKGPHSRAPARIVPAREGSWEVGSTPSPGTGGARPQLRRRASRSDETASQSPAAVGQARPQSPCWDVTECASDFPDGNGIRASAGVSPLPCGSGWASDASASPPALPTRRVRAELVSRTVSGPPGCGSAPSSALLSRSQGPLVRRRAALPVPAFEAEASASDAPACRRSPNLSWARRLGASVVAAPTLQLPPQLPREPGGLRSGLLRRMARGIEATWPQAQQQQVQRGASAPAPTSGPAVAPRPRVRRAALGLPPPEPSPGSATAAAAAAAEDLLAQLPVRASQPSPPPFTGPPAPVRFAADTCRSSAPDSPSRPRALRVPPSAARLPFGPMPSLPFSGGAALAPTAQATTAAFRATVPFANAEGASLLPIGGTAMRPAAVLS